MPSQESVSSLDAGRLAQLAQEKEQEWRALQQLRTQSLEASLTEKEKLLAEENEKFNQLKEDFKYNLKLLNDRDAELVVFETTVTGDYTAL